MLDFKGLNKILLLNATDLLLRWLPGGKVIGNEYTCGSLTGEAGNSCKINIRTGKWADFSTGHKGGDLISLYAAINGIDQKEAYVQLENDMPKYVSSHAPTQPEPVALIQPPTGHEPPDFNHHRHGAPTEVWTYRDKDGDALYYIARYDVDGGKEFCPFSWSTAGKWVRKAWPAPRHIYGLELLNDKPNAAICVVEGEKACEAARKVLAGSAYVVVTWPGGSQAWNKVDWTPIYGRSVLLWPDADDPGREAMLKLSAALLGHVTEVKILDVRGDDGRDAADWEPGFTLADWKAWAKPLVKLITPPVVERLPEMPERPSVDVNVTVSKPKPIYTEPQCALHERLGLAKTGGGALHMNMDNVTRILERHEDFKDFCWYDDFHDKIFVKLGDVARPWADHDYLDLTLDLQSRFGLSKINKHCVEDAIIRYAHKRVKNEPQDWVSGLEWDETPRIESFLIDYCGAEDNEYTRAVTKNWWVALAARIFNPGCKFDNILILEGRQNIAKSMLFDIIGGKFYCAPMEDVRHKDFIISARGKFLLELPELDAMGSANNKTKKRVLSTRTDRLRGHYDRQHEDKGRSFVFVGTTNEDTYLDDDTGDRRYWPVKISHVDVESVKKIREQLFAEAYECFKNGDKWWIVPDGAMLEQASRGNEDMWTQYIENYIIDKKLKQVSTIEIATNVINFDVKDVNFKVQMRIKKILKKLGFIEKQNAQTDMKRRWVKENQPRLENQANGHLATVRNVDNNDSQLAGQRVIKNHAPGGEDIFL